MKTVLFYFFLLSGFIVFISCIHENSVDQKLRLALAGEDVIDLEKNAVRESDGIDQMQLFIDSTSLRLGGDIQTKAESIDIGAFVALRDSAQKIIPAESNYILALRIMYGLNATTKKMNLLYEPLLLKKTPTSNPKINAEYTAYQGRYIYKYNNLRSKFVETTDRSGLRIYKDHIKIKRTGMGFSDFQVANDSTGDVKEVVFSFQELDSIIHGNPSTTKITILNAAEKMRINQKAYTKHILLLGPDDLVNALPIFYMKFGNLSHLCPPSCGATPYKYNLK